MYFRTALAAYLISVTQVTTACDWNVMGVQLGDSIPKVMQTLGGVFEPIGPSGTRFEQSEQPERYLKLETQEDGSLRSMFGIVKVLPNDIRPLAASLCDRFVGECDNSRWRPRAGSSNEWLHEKRYLSTEACSFSYEIYTKVPRDWLGKKRKPRGDQLENTFLRFNLGYKIVTPSIKKQPETPVPPSKPYL